MKILAFSDLHKNVDAARKIVQASAQADILVGAGDFANFGEGSGEIIEILQSAKIPTVLVCGNHDNLVELREVCASWNEGYLLHGQTEIVGGITFFGLGGEIPRRNKAHWNVAVSEEDAAKALADCPENAVLITHMPPFGYADQQRDGTHDGSKSVAAAIEEKQPSLHFCGHIHSAWGSRGMIGKSPVHNLGPGLNWFEV